MVTYTFKTLADVADAFTTRGREEQKVADRSTTQRERDLAMARCNTWMTAANLLRHTVLEPSTPPAPAFLPDTHLYVITDSVERAREFLGTPKDWPCEVDEESTRADDRCSSTNGLRVFRLPAKGLKLGA